MSRSLAVNFNLDKILFIDYLIASIYYYMEPVISITKTKLIDAY